MPRRSAGPRLWLDKVRGTWSITDGKYRRRTGFGEADHSEAEKALAAYIGAKWRPQVMPTPAVADILAIYATEHARSTVDEGYILGCRMGTLLEWWGIKHLPDVTAVNCRAYAAHRVKANTDKATASGIKLVGEARGTTGARGDLEVLRAAINYYHREKMPLAAVPRVWLPQKPDGREQWLTRGQIARFLWAARRTVENLEVDTTMPPRLVRRLCRFILLAFYSGSRSGVVYGTRYSLLDFENDYMQRKPRGARKSKKQAPPHRMPKRLKIWLLRWKRIDAELADYVVHRSGAQIEKMRKAWDGARELAGLAEDVTPHTLRHSRATHLMRNRAVANEDAAQFMGMTLQTFLETYGHHDPDWQKDAADAR